MGFAFNQIAGFVSRRLGNVAKEIPPPRLTFDTHPLRAQLARGSERFGRLSKGHESLVHHEALLANGDVPLSGIITPKVTAPTQLATGKYAQGGLRVGDWGGFFTDNHHEKAVASSINALNPVKMTHAQMKMLMQGNGAESLGNLMERNTLAEVAQQNLKGSVQIRERIAKKMDALLYRQVALRQRIEADVAQANAPVPQARQGIRAGIQRFFGFKN